jgi:hypothetical protein
MASLYQNLTQILQPGRIWVRYDILDTGVHTHKSLNVTAESGPIVTNEGDFETFRSALQDGASMRSMAFKAIDHHCITYQQKSPPSGLHGCKSFNITAGTGRIVTIAGDFERSQSALRGGTNMISMPFKPMAHHHIPYPKIPSIWCARTQILEYLSRERPDCED